ncbi:hypothetical protein KXV48_001205, partial [Aspergillus fumigatus]
MSLRQIYPGAGEALSDRSPTYYRCSWTRFCRCKREVLNIFLARVIEGARRILAGCPYSGPRLGSESATA